MGMRHERRLLLRFYPTDWCEYQQLFFSDDECGSSEQPAPAVRARCEEGDVVEGRVHWFQAAARHLRQTTSGMCETLHAWAMLDLSGATCA
jgi:hypothetical protein